MKENHEHARLDGDGDPNSRGPVLIGIAPQAPEPTQAPAKLKIVLPGDDEASNNSGGLILPFAAAPEPEPTLTWAEYAAWRRTKCPPVDDLSRATHELVGEVGELAELILGEGPAVFYGDKRSKLIDECGDIFFCACWTLDAWGSNPLLGADDLEILRVAEDSEILLFTAALANNPLESVIESPNFVGPLFGLLSKILVSTLTHVALTANACKKQVYQKRDQDVQAQVSRIGAALVLVNQILIVANSNVEEALLANMTKLDKRYPDGWHANVGGGIRTEG